MGFQLAVSYVIKTIFFSLLIQMILPLHGCAGKQNRYAMKVIIDSVNWLQFDPDSYFTPDTNAEKQKIKMPYFIGFFILAMMINTYFARTRSISIHIVQFAETGLTVALFLIGAELPGSVLKSVSIKPLIQGILLWVSFLRSNPFCLIKSDMSLSI